MNAPYRPTSSRIGYTFELGRREFWLQLHWELDAEGEHCARLIRAECAWELTSRGDRMEGSLTEEVRKLVEDEFEERFGNDTDFERCVRERMQKYAERGY